MTPAEHYQQAEAILAGINEESEKARPRIEKLLADDAYDQAREATDVMARMVDLGLAQAQVHATLATIDPDVLWPPRVVGEHGIAGCTCKSLPMNPLAITHVDPDCPIHGGT